MKAKNFKLTIYFVIVFLFIIGTIFAEMTDNRYSKHYDIANEDRYTLEGIWIYRGESVSIKFDSVIGEFNFTVSLSSVALLTETINSNKTIRFKSKENVELHFSVGTVNAVSFDIKVEITGLPNSFGKTALVGLIILSAVFLIDLLSLTQKNGIHKKIDNNLDDELTVKLQSIWSLRSYSQDFINKQHIVLIIISMLLSYSLSNPSSIYIEERFNVIGTNSYVFSYSKFTWNIAARLLHLTMVYAIFMLPVLNFREFTYYRKSHPDHARIYPYQYRRTLFSKIFLSYLFIFLFSSFRFVLQTQGSRGDITLITQQMILTSILLTSTSLIIVICIFYGVWIIFKSPTINLIVFPVTGFRIINQTPTENWFETTSNTTIFLMARLGSDTHFSPDLSSLLIFRSLIMIILLMILLNLPNIYRFVRRPLYKLKIIS